MCKHLSNSITSKFIAAVVPPEIILVVVEELNFVSVRDVIEVIIGKRVSQLALYEETRPGEH